MSFESHRISKDYVLLDFLFDHDVYRYGQPLDFQRVFTDGNLQTGQKFVDCLLQPLTDKYGPTSIAGAFWPEKVRTWSGHYRSSPHQWNEQYGAAADVVFHDHVNRDEAPIKLCHEIDRSNQDFDWIITYAGSEFICFCYRESKNRTALYENVRVPGEKAQYVQHGQSPSARRRRRDLLPAARPDWRRAEDEGVGKSGNRLRAHHIRVGRYFVLLDFCRSVEGLRRGIRTVPQITLRNWNTPEVKVARRFAEVLDPLVDKHGRVTVLRGMEPADMSNDADAHKHRWSDPETSVYRLVFLVNQDTPIEAWCGDVCDDDRVVCAHVDVHDQSSLQVTLEVSRFEPLFEWSSAQRPG